MVNHEHTPELAGTLTAYHFPSTKVSVWFGDVDIALEGYVTFNDAFWQIEGEWTVVYTEHFGYHVYRTVSTIEIDGQEGPEQLTESVQEMLNNPLDTEV